MRVMCLFSTALFLLFAFNPSALLAKTDLTVDTTGYSTTFTDLDFIEQTYEAYPDCLFDTNKTVIPSALAMINTLGYPNGRSSIKRFPHVEFGFAMGGGVLEYKRMQKYEDENPTIPFGGVNGGFHFGTGIVDRVDITFKIFVFSFESIAENTKKIEGEGDNTKYKFELKDADLNSYGAKLRYNLVKRRVIYPLVFAFGGISVNLGFDYLKGKMESYFEFTDTQYIDANISGMNYVNTPVSVAFQGVPKIEFDIYSITPEALLYFDLFHHFTIYTGPSASINFGEFIFSLQSNGVMTSETLNVPLAIASINAEYKMKPKQVITKWNIGLEFHLLALKLQVEAATVLTSATESFTGQVGLRFQF